MTPDSPEKHRSPDAIVAALCSFPKFGTGLSLHRMLQMADAVPDGARLIAVDAIKITGSKGKGSVSAMTCQIVRELGFRTGLYTSPHLLKFNERVQIDGVPISDEQLDAAAGWITGLRENYEGQFPGDRIGAFEAFTAMALRHFAACNVQALVCEAGIGGRYDPTRVITGSVAALTSVELEHSEILGNTLELIAFDKADLCPSGGSLVAGAIDRELFRRLNAYCRIRGVELIDSTAGTTVTGVSCHSGVMQFHLACGDIDFGELSSRLVGEHQARNAAVAVHLVQRWLARNHPQVGPDGLRAAVRAALPKVQWPGRLQLVHRSPDVIIDVGHTPQSARSAARAMRQMYPRDRILLVTGVSANKNVRGVLAELVPIADAIICTRAYHKGAAVADVAEYCQSFRQGDVLASIETIDAAMEAAITQARAQNMLVFVAGGLFLAIEAMVSIQGGDPRAIEYFND